MNNNAIGFVANQLSYRGTETAIYSYMEGCQEILKMDVYLFYPEKGDTSSLEKFRQRFGHKVTSYNSLNHLDHMFKTLDIGNAYFIRSGGPDEHLIPGVRNMIHCVFDKYEGSCKHYAYVSEWLARHHSDYKFVPHIVELPSTREDFKPYLGIPENALVFGRLGGNDSFDDSEAHKVVYKVASKRPDIYFLFMNTDVFCPSLPNIIHIAPTTDLETKTAFINTCDAMLHSRLRGETFGLAVCEFLHQGKPVITRINSPERSHVQIMGDRGFYYSSAKELEAILLNFPKSVPCTKYLVGHLNKESVMQQFKKVFLD